MIEQIHGVKRLGISIMTIVLLFATVWILLFLVYVTKITMADISGHLTMLFTLIGGVIGGYLGVQTINDQTKIKTGNNNQDKTAVPSA